jgi:prevent-host-death family protein
MSWQLQEAKNKLSEVVDRALKDGPQEITRHGKKTAVIISMQEYKKLKNQKGNLADFFRKSPLSGIDFDRRKDLPRKVEF